MLSLSGGEGACSEVLAGPMDKGMGEQQQKAAEPERDNSAGGLTDRFDTWLDF